jgi:hypothetical protein
MKKQTILVIIGLVLFVTGVSIGSVSVGYIGLMVACTTLITGAIRYGEANEGEK